MTTLSLLVHCRTIAYTGFTLPVLALLPQWIPNQLHTCWRLIYDALSSDAIEEVEFHEGQVVDRQWILHLIDFRSFQIFGFLDDFVMPSARPGRFSFYGKRLQARHSPGFLFWISMLPRAQGIGCVPTYWYYWVRVYYRALAE